MMNFYGNGFGAVGFNPFLGSLMAGLSFLLLPLMVWSFFWKGWALWRAAKNNSQLWFIILLVVNTLGILEILYLFVFGKKQEKAIKTSKRK